MPVTALDIGKRVRWTDRGHTYHGILHRHPTPGTHPWFRTGGRCEIRADDGSYPLVHATELELDDTPTEVT